MIKQMACGFTLAVVSARLILSSYGDDDADKGIYIGSAGQHHQVELWTLED